jgi:predicted DNA-binding transcriptional regulator AlpA
VIDKSLAVGDIRIRDVQRGAAPSTAPNAESEITIGAQRYVGAQRLASILGISLRTLSRLDAAGTGPPKIKIGRKVLFDLGKLPEWLASREIPSTRING